MYRLVTTKSVFFLIATTFMVVGMIRSIGIYRLIPMEMTIALLTCASIFGLFWQLKRELNRNEVFLLLGITSLLPYSLITSRYSSLSVLMAFFPIAISVFYISLTANGLTKSRQASCSNGSSAAIEGAKLAFIICTSTHALTQVLFYIFTPVRTTGLMDDFSQASMLLLCAYAMAYPMFKKKVFFSAFSLLFFTAYFVSFSRTANFLLVIVFIALFISAARQNEKTTVLKLGALAILALGFVYAYPNFIEVPTVDRGGLTKFSTLNSRTIYWQAAWDAIQSRPILGHGIGTYTYTGIRELEPFHVILYVHNDYLQIWHDLGIFWLLAFISLIGYIIFKSAPINIPFLLIGRIVTTSNIIEERKFISWVMLVCIAMYMGINFLINNVEFQLAIAIFVAELLRK